MMSVTGQRGGEPLKVGPGVGDLIPGTLAAFGIMSAVFYANKTGEGQFLDVAMYDAVLAFSERIVPQFAYTGQIPSTEGNAHPGLCPFGVFACKDGWVSIACPGDDFWAILVTAMDRKDMIDDERYVHNWTRVEHMEEVIETVTAWTSQYTKAELTQKLGGKIPFGPVNDAQDLFNDDHVKVRNMLVEVEQPGADRPYAITNTPIRMTKTQGGVQTRAPLLGEHTDEVLARAGFSTSEITRLREEGAVQ
jgi:formyl-CoA transferase